MSILRRFSLLLLLFTLALVPAAGQAAAAEGAFIGGNVFDPEGALAEDVDVEIWHQGEPIWRQHFLVPGPYRAGPFPPGTYTAIAQARGLARQIYPDHICLATCTLEAGGQAVELQIGEDRQGIDFHLHRFGSLAGRVEDRESGAGIAGARLRFYEAANRQRLATSARTAADGTFAAQLPPGSYLVAAGAEGREWRAHADVPFLERDEAAALSAATPVSVPEGGQLALPALGLRRLGRLRGRVVDSATFEPIAGARAWAFQRNLEPAAGGADAGDDGSFEISGFEPGTYYLLIDGPGSRDLLVGGDEACTVAEVPLSQRPVAACDPTRGAAFAVTFDQAADSGEILLPAEARIRGTMRLADGRVALTNLQIFNTGGSLVVDFYPPAPVGQWSFDVAVPGGAAYFLKGRAAEHRTQLYDHVDCPGVAADCSDFALATPVALTPGEIRAGIDFDLQLYRSPCIPSPTALCLGNGRFTVRNRHWNGASFVPSAAGRITEEAGYFTFFDSANVELVVKVLDACQNFDSIWVFATGLTDVSTSLQIRDNWAARTHLYLSSGPYRPLADTTSFDTCGFGLPEGWPAEKPAAAPQLAAPRPDLAPNGCGSDPVTSLCLGDRFKVEAEWETALGERGAGRPQPLTADTGFFHFFSPGNIEVVVKVLNACRSDLNNHYWVFAAGLTDVAVTITVTDTVTGEPQYYLSPLGRLFQPIFDLEAFAGCS